MICFTSLSLLLLTFKLVFNNKFLLMNLSFMLLNWQKIESFDKRYQYLLFAAEPYETISFKVILSLSCNYDGI